MKRKFIIDCDTGTDDAIAILGAMGCEEIEILGITSVNGNVREEFTSRNNLDLCEYVGLNVPVCHGATLPLSSGYRNSSDKTHGKTGLGSIVIPEAKETDFDPRIASRFLYEKALECKGELELLVIGPMTNIALAVIQYPDFPKLIKHLYFMGGAVVGGNVTNNAEFNIWADPEAAHTVFMAGMPLTMVGLDVTLKAAMTEDDIKELRVHDSKASNLTADLLDFMVIRRNNGGEDLLMHDALALAAAVYPGCMTYKEYWMDVETNGTYTRGHTFTDWRNRLGKEPNVKAAMEVDVPAFRKWLVERINSY